MEMHTRGCLARTIQLLSCNMFFLAVVCQYPAMDYPHVFWLTTRWGPLTTISGFILSFTRLQPWLNRVCRGCNYLITRGAPSCNTVECFYFADLARPNEPNSKTPCQYEARTLPASMNGPKIHVVFFQFPINNQ